MTIREAIWWVFSEVNFLDWIAYTLIGILSAVLGVQAVLGVLNLGKWLIGG